MVLQHRRPRTTAVPTHRDALQYPAGFTVLTPWRLHYRYTVAGPPYKLTVHNPISH